jgi:putative hydrolase of the HAD superfamily
MGSFGHGLTLSVSKTLRRDIIKAKRSQMIEVFKKAPGCVLPGRDGVVLPRSNGTGMTIQAVFFDMGGTLESFGYTRQQRLEATPGLQQRLLSAGIDLHLGNEQLFDVVSAGLERYHQWSLNSLEELPPQRVWREYILAGCPIDFNRLDAIAEDLMLYYETHYYQRQMRPEMPAVLEAIRQMGLKIGLISNVCSHGLVPAKLNEYGIRHYFDPIVLSCEYGRRKPDPAIFHYAARLANVPTGECVYVGDRIARDIVGARRAGFRLAVQIINDFDHGEEDEGAEPDAVIHRMTELLDILKADTGISRPANGSQSQVRALLFDAGDILYHRPNPGRNLRIFLEELGIADKNIPAATKNSLKHQAYHGSITQSQYQESILGLYGLTDPAQIERGKQLMDMDDNNVQFFKGVPETLKKLKEKGYMLGIITDTAMPLHVKLSWFERGGFGHVWDSIVSSKEMGIQKPDPKIYHAALQQLGLSADQAVFVGHDPVELNGAQTVGMKTIAFNYGEKAKADFHIRNFADLLKVPIISSEDDCRQVETSDERTH